MNTNKTLTTTLAILAMTATTYADFTKRQGGRADRYVIVRTGEKQVNVQHSHKVEVEKERKKVSNRRAKHALRRYGRRP